MTYSTYSEVNDAKLFTVVCLPEPQGTFPTVIIRNPYVDAEELCDAKTAHNTVFPKIPRRVKNKIIVFFREEIRQF